MIAAADRPHIEIGRAALFLDVDGTLAPIETRPELVGPDRARTETLRRIEEALDGRLALASGRTIADVDRIVEGAVMCVAGMHGLERRDRTGRLLRSPPAPGMERARAGALRFAEGRPGILAEDKGACLALHYREASHLEDEVVAIATKLAAACGLVIQPGKMVVELRTPGSDKGDVVRTFLQEPPFEGARPIFVGDDLTDEDGFAAAVENGGAGILVGDSRATAAKARLRDVPDVLAWLDRSIRQGGFTVEGDAWAD